MRPETGHTGFFDITTGVPQGCVLSPLLFLVTLDLFMQKTITSMSTGIPWTDHSHLTDLDFADDVALLAEDETRLQEVTNHLDRSVSASAWTSQRLWPSDPLSQP